MGAAASTGIEDTASAEELGAASVARSQAEMDYANARMGLLDDKVTQAEEEAAASAAAAARETEEEAAEKYLANSTTSNKSVLSGLGTWLSTIRDKFQTTPETKLNSVSELSELSTEEEAASKAVIDKAINSKPGVSVDGVTSDITAEEASAKVTDIVKNNRDITRQRAGLAVIAALVVAGGIAASVILAWYAYDNTGCYQINNGIRTKQVAGGPGTGNYYDWSTYPDRCACSQTSMISSGLIEASGSIGAGIPAFCGNIFSKKNTTGSKIESGFGITASTETGSGTAGTGTAGSGTAGSGTAGTGTAGTGTAGTGTAGSGTAGTGTAGTGTAGTGTAGTGTPAGMPPYPVCSPIADAPCDGNIYYSFYTAGPLSLIANVIAQGEIAAAAAGQGMGTIIQIGIILAFIALVLFIVLNFVTRPKK